MEVFGENFEDAYYTAYKDEIHLFTTDFFTPIVNSPYDFGAIAVANALSDIYAKGGEPKVALGLLMFPFSTLDIQIVKEILKGANDKLKEANVILGGGHTIEDDTIKFGLAVFGTAKEKVWKINTIKENDDVFLTKPLGTGIISQAIKLNKLEEKSVQEAIDSMKKLNKYAKDLLLEFPISACTDITGYGLLGHIFNMVKNTEYTIEIHFNKIPFFKEAKVLAKQNIFPGGTKKNLSYFENKVAWQAKLETFQKLMCADAQTSGGLLFSCPPQYSKKIEEKFKKYNHFIKKIGKVIQKNDKDIKII